MHAREWLSSPHMPGMHDPSLHPSHLPSPWPMVRLLPPRCRLPRCRRAQSQNAENYAKQKHKLANNSMVNR